MYKLVARNAQMLGMHVFKLVKLTSRRSMKGSVSSSQAMLVLFFSPPESPRLRGLPMTGGKERAGDVRIMRSNNTIL